MEAPVTTKIMSWMAEQIQTRPELMLVRSVDDILTCKRAGKLGIFYHFQGPSPLAYDLDRVWYYKQAGVGVMQFAYNTRNPYANGITERVDGGLSILGIKLVEACNKARMIVDVSHTAEKSALDAIRASSEPVILSHGNALGQINNLPLIDARLLNPELRYQVKVRAHLDIESLPAPMRPLAYISSDWQLDSDWVSWPLTQ